MILIQQDMAFRVVHERHASRNSTTWCPRNSTWWNRISPMINDGCIECFGTWSWKHSILVYIFVCAYLCTVYIICMCIYIYMDFIYTHIIIYMIYDSPILVTHPWCVTKTASLFISYDKHFAAILLKFPKLPTIQRSLRHGQPKPRKCCGPCPMCKCVCACMPWQRLQYLG